MNFPTTFKFLVLVLVLLILPCNDCTLSKSDRKKKPSKKANNGESVGQQQQSNGRGGAASAGDIISGPLKKTVYERGLVTTDLKHPHEVIRNHAGYGQDTSLRNFDGHVLGYITPWNGGGYDVAKTFGSKLSSISPVWLQIVPQTDGNGEDNHQKPYSVMGTHDIDKKWMQEVRKKAGHPLQIIPRVLFDKWTGEDYMKLFSQPWRSEAIAKLITSTITKYGFEGVVLEVWSQLGGQAKQQISDVIETIGKTVKAKGKVFVLVIPPPVYAGDVTGMFDAQDMDNLANHVDYFSLMTYDYSNPQRPGPNSPMEWVRKCIDRLDPNEFHRDKILLGLNFYGYDFTASGGGPILGRDFVQLLNEAVTSSSACDVILSCRCCALFYMGRKVGRAFHRVSSRFRIQT